MRRTTERLTDDLFQRLSGDDAEALARQAILVCTVDEDAWPHPAMLSYFEVAATDPDNLQLAVYNDSRTCANMRARGTATLVVVDEGLVCYIRGRVLQVAPAMSTAPYNAIVNLRVDQVVFDEPPPDLEPGAFVTSGITYRPRTGPALERARAVLKELRAVRTA
jgi:flavin reductase (DIM6/NTAB) family NADH-FMN oxidoreductase RutF